MQKSMTGIDHIGVAVYSLSERLPYYTGILKLPVESIRIVEEQGVRAAFLPVGTVKLELLEPLHEESTLAKFLAKKGEGVHHIALSVDRLQTTLIDEMIITQPPFTGAKGKKVAFLDPNQAGGVLYELCERAPKK